MVNPAHTVLSFSGAYAETGLPFMEGAPLIDCSDIEGTVCYCDGEAEAEILSRIVTRPVEGIHWIDSGDYHHVSALWMSMVQSPFDLLLLDNHPDMQEPAFGGILSCGGWVRTALERYPLLEEVVIAGIDPSLQCECEGFGERVKVFDRDRLKCNDSKVISAELSGRPLPLYISFDKDVLARDYARTDWDQGNMTLEYLLESLQGVFSTRKVIGVDICGEIPSHKGGTPSDFSVNASTDRILQEFFVKELEKNRNRFDK